MRSNLNESPWQCVRTAGRVALFMFLCAVGVVVAGPIAKQIPADPAELAIGLFTSVWAFALTIAFVRWDRLSLADVGAAFTKRSVTKALLGFSLGLSILGAWAVLCAIAGPVTWQGTKDASLGALGVFTLAYVLLACREELAFHGYPLRRLDRSFGMWFAQILVALVFVAEHRLGGMSWERSLLGPGVGSLLFGMAAMATRGLAIPIGLHAGWNIGHWSLGLKGNTGFWQGAVPAGKEDLAENVALLAYLTVMGIGIVAFWLRYRTTRDSEKKSQASH